SSLLLIRPGKEVVPKYLYYCLLSPYFQRIVQSRLEGATTPHLYQRDIATFPVFLAPKSEQRRIVAILDEAFEGLSRARANAEANLEEVAALRESAISDILRPKQRGWLHKKLADCFKLASGDNLTAKD